jgi:hypothetical protein
VTTILTRRARTCDARPTTGRVLVALAAIVTVIAVGIISLFASPASAAPTVGAGNGVGVIQLPGSQTVGPHEQILAGQGRARAPNYDHSASASGVSAEEAPPGSSGAQC